MVWLMLLTVSLKDLKAAPSAITPECLIDTLVDVAEKSVEPEPPQVPHVLEKKQDEECLSNFLKNHSHRLQQRQRRMRMRAVRRPPRQAPSTTMEMKYFFSFSSQAPRGSSLVEAVVVVVGTPDTVTIRGMVVVSASGLSSVAWK